MLDNLFALLKARLHNIHLGLTTGDWTPAREDIKQNFQEYKHLYVGLTILIIIYVLLEVYYPGCLNIKRRKYKQTGGDDGNNIPAPKAEQTRAEQAHTSPTSKLTKSQIASGVQSAGGLCSGDGFFAKICQGTGSGIMSIFKFIGMIYMYSFIFYISLYMF